MKVRVLSSQPLVLRMRADNLADWHKRAMATLAVGQAALNESHAFITVMRRTVDCIVHYYDPEQQLCILTREFAQPHVGGAVRLLVGQRFDDTFQMISVGISPTEAPPKFFDRGFLLSGKEAAPFIAAYRHS